MPRLHWSQVWRLHREDASLPLVFQGCRDVAAARNELRWLRKHARAVAKAQAAPATSNEAKSRGPPLGWRTLFKRYCSLRSHGRPIQYIIGDQPFGRVNILCRPGVLIPRAETEAYTAYLAKLIIDGRLRRGQDNDADRSFKPFSSSPMRILDLCTGTGCIPLALHADLSANIEDLQIQGVDISAKATRLANKNLRWNVARGNLPPHAQEQIRFIQGDIFSANSLAPDKKCDIVISNPPYISPASFRRDTSRSVRNWEPKLALVPQVPASLPNLTLRKPPGTAKSMDDKEIIEDGDIFYPRLLTIAKSVQAKIALFETANLDQADRVAQMARSTKHWDGVEIWRDWPDQQGDGHEQDTSEPALFSNDARIMQAQRDAEGSPVITMRGQGNGRAVFCWREGV